MKRHDLRPGGGSDSPVVTGIDMDSHASPETLEALIEASPLAILFHNLDGTIRLWNKSAERIFGWRSEEVVGRQNPIIPPDKQKEYRGLWDRVIRGERFSGLELRRMRKDGTPVEISLSPAPMIDRSGRLIGIMSIIEDITGRRQMEEALRESEERFRTIFEGAAAGMNTIDPNGRYLQVNPAFCRYIGYSRQELQNLTVEDLTHPEDLEKTRSLFEEVRSGTRRLFHYEKKFLRKDGMAVWGEVTTAWLFDSAGLPTCGIGLVQDITDRKNAGEAQEEQLHFLQSLIDAIPNPIFYKDSEGRYLGCNRVLEEALGITRERMVGRTVQEIAPLERAQRCHQEDLALFASPGVRTYESGITFADGKPREVIFSKAPLFSRDGRLKGLVGTILDITDLKRAEREIRQLAFYDTLTGLPNRTLLKDRFRQILIQAGRDGSQVGVLFLDLDRFKGINDSYGHTAGDLLLQAVAQRLQACLRASDTVSRLGGDEFVIVLPSIRDIEDIAQIARKIMDSLADSYFLNGQEIFSTASMGIAVFPSDGQDVDHLLRHADTAMYAAKERGRNHFQFFSQEMNQRAVERVMLENSLRRAIERQELMLHFQPQVDLGSGRITGMEALLRWRHPEMGLVPPAKFIPVAEETGLIIPISEWVLEMACRQMKEWYEAGFTSLRMAVNVSGSVLQRRHLIQVVKKALQESGLPPEGLELELTESTLMENAESVRHILQELKGIGVHLAVDDFGTGYSSLNYLKHFPLDRLKIDRSFVAEITTNSDDAAIANAIIAMARSLGLSVIAEGVEKREQMAFLRSSRCHEMQGFYFGRPAPAEAISELLVRGMVVGEARLAPDCKNR